MVAKYKSKFCFECKILKELSMFPMNGKRRSSYCNDCNSTHIEKQKERKILQQRSKDEERRKNLSDSYIRQILSVGVCSKKSIPQELVESKRIQLQIKRFLKEQQK